MTHPILQEITTIRGDRWISRESYAHPSSTPIACSPQEDPSPKQSYLLQEKRLWVIAKDMKILPVRVFARQRRKTSFEAEHFDCGQSLTPLQGQPCHTLSATEAQSCSHEQHFGREGVATLSASTPYKAEPTGRTGASWTPYEVSRG